MGKPENGSPHAKEKDGKTVATRKMCGPPNFVGRALSLFMNPGKMGDKGAFW
jgi:hypothetical protein